MVKNSLKRVYVIPNAITAFGLTCGLFVIFKTSIAASIAENPHDIFALLQASVILLLIAGLADIADGAVARLIHAQSEFGIYFDSLADAVNFGVAPPLLILKSLTGSLLSPFLVFILILASILYTLCGVLRLVRFNVHARENKDSQQSKMGHFTGLPIPAAASCALSAVLLSVSPMADEYFPFSSETRAWILAGILVVLGYFMISRWKFPSLKALHFRIPSIYLVFATGIFAVTALYGILDYFPAAYFIVSWLYLAISWILSLIRLILGKRSKTLVDFDPDDED